MVTVNNPMTAKTEQMLWDGAKWVPSMGDSDGRPMPLMMGYYYNPGAKGVPPSFDPVVIEVDPDGYLIPSTQNVIPVSAPNNLPIDIAAQSLPQQMVNATAQGILPTNAENMWWNGSEWIKALSSSGGVLYADPFAAIPVHSQVFDGTAWINLKGDSSGQALVNATAQDVLPIRAPANLPVDIAAQSLPQQMVNATAQDVIPITAPLAVAVDLAVQSLPQMMVNATVQEAIPTLVITNATDFIWVNQTA